jgi:hypothetical protein
MAWTNPRTWTDGENVTASQFNSNLRDDLNSVWHLIARKTSDQSVTSSTTMVNESALIAPMAANEVWFLRYTILYTAAAAGDLNVTFTLPSGGTIAFCYNSWPDSGGTIDTNVWTGTASPNASRSFNGISTTVPSALVIEGVFINGGSSGDVRLQFAQVTSNATASTIKTNSALIGAKLV